MRTPKAKPKAKRTTDVKRTAKTTRKARRVIHPMDLPATYLKDGSRLATLREFLDPSVPTRPLAELSHNEQAQLVVQRLRMGEEFPIRMLGAPGIVDRRRAIREVKAGTHIGRQLIDLELYVIRFLAEKPPR